MNERYVSGLQLLAGVLWTLAFGLLAAAWVTWHRVGDDSFLPRLCAWSACVASLAALAVYARRLTCRVMALIRSTSGLDDEGRRSDLRSIR